MSLLSAAVQPSLLTLLSSTSQPTLSPLFFKHTDPSLPSTSHIIYAPDARQTKSNPKRNLIPKHISLANIAHSVVHIQSPTLSKTYIQAGCSFTETHRLQEKGRSRAQPLGIELGWFAMQIKRLGRREMSFEVGIVDAKGREGVVRCSSFMKSPVVHRYRVPPLIHLPLSLPARDASCLTSWLYISLNLSTVIPLFNSLPQHTSQVSEDENEDEVETIKPKKRRKLVDIPNGSLMSVSYVRVYANCRVRRIWFAANGERTLEDMGKGVADEWGLYAPEAEP